MRMESSCRLALVVVLAVSPAGGNCHDDHRAPLKDMSVVMSEREEKNIEPWMALATKALDGVFGLGGSTVDRGMLVQSAGGLANFPAFVAGKEWQGHSCYPG